MRDDEPNKSDHARHVHHRSDQKRHDGNIHFSIRPKFLPHGQREIIPHEHQVQDAPLRKEVETSSRHKKSQDTDRHPGVGADIPHHPELDRPRFRRIRHHGDKEAHSSRAGGVQSKTGQKQCQSLSFAADRRNKKNQKGNKSGAKKSRGADPIKAPDHPDTECDRQHRAQTCARGNPQ